MNAITSRYVLSSTGLENIREALGRATTPREFFKLVDAILGKDQMLLPEETPFEFEVPLTKGRGNFGNASLLFDALRLDPANAADGRRWTYLAFATFRPYMLEQWNPENVKPEKWKNRIKARWIINETPARSSLIRHGIARLWWVANLGYEALPDPQLPVAQWVLGNEDRMLAIYDRSLGSDPARVRALYELLKDDTRTDQSQVIRSLGRNIQVQMAFRELGALGPDLPKEIAEIDRLTRMSPDL